MEGRGKCVEKGKVQRNAKRKKWSEKCSCDVSFHPCPAPTWPLSGCGRKVYILVTLVCVGHSVLYDVITTARPHDHETRGHDMHREGLLHGSSPTRTRILYPEAPEVAAAAAWYMGASPHRPESALRHWAFASPGVVILYFTAVQFSSPGQLREQFHKNRTPATKRVYK